MDPLAHVEAMLDAAVGAVFPSAQLIVVDAGVTKLARAVGDSTMTTRFDSASLTKALSTTAIALRLLKRGVVTLELRPRPEATLGQLLAHAGGLPGWRLLGDPERPSAGMRASVIERARTEPLEYVPGARSLYSDLGFILVGDALERAAHDRLDRLFLAEVAHPLGAELAYAPRGLQGDVAPTEGALRGVVHDENARAMGGVAGHAGLFGTAADVDKLVAAWVGAWHGEDRWLDPALVRRAFAPCGVPGSTWGLGWDHPSPAGSSAGQSWPRDGVGHLGFTGCSIWIDPPRRRWVILVSNRVHPTRANEAMKAFRPQLHDAIYAAL